MTRSPLIHRSLTDTRFVVLLTAAHAAVALPALWLWASACDRARRTR
jgi:hypothetical protein